MNFHRNNSCFVRNNTVISCNFNDKFEELFNNYSVDSSKPVKDFKAKIELLDTKML